MPISLSIPDQVLIQAVKENKYEDVLLAFSFEADPHALVNDDLEVLHYASSKGCYEIVKAILDKGVDPMTQSRKTKETSLQITSRVLDQERMHPSNPSEIEGRVIQSYEKVVILLEQMK